MDAAELLKVAGAAVAVADLAEELIELLESLGPELLSDCTNLDEYCEFCTAVESYIDLRDKYEVNFG
jgi:hypothetical protein